VSIKNKLSNFWSLLFVIAFCLVLLFDYEFAQAAILYLEPESSELNRGETVIVKLNLDIDKKEGCINAIDAVIKYDDNLELVDVSTGSSLISLWVENPIINNKNKTLSFAGGIPNGYCGEIVETDNITNTLLEMVFKISDKYVLPDDNSKTAKIYFSGDTTVYLNDGIGTSKKPGTEDVVLSLSGKLSTSKSAWQQKVSEDNIPPAEFVVTLQKNTSVFGGKNYIVFNTTDKQTGIDHYEVMEEPVSQFGSFSWGRVDAPWVVARSPYVLKDQSLKSIIRVRAVDKAGNEYIANLIPNSKNSYFNNYKFMLFIGFLFTLLFILLIIKLLKREKDQLKNNDNDKNNNHQHDIHTGYRHDSEQEDTNEDYLSDKEE